MYLLTITKGDRTEEYVFKMEVNNDNIVLIIEQYFLKSQKDYADFYLDMLEFMKDVTYDIEYLEYPNLYGFYTKVRGYDTYDSGVFSAWTESRARELAEKKSKDFKNSDIDIIGRYNKQIEEEICCSFNAG